VIAETIQQISYLCPRSAVGTGISGMCGIFHPWVADIKVLQSHEQVTGYAYARNRN